MLSNTHTTIVVTADNATQRWNAIDTVAAHIKLHTQHDTDIGELERMLDWIDGRQKTACENKSTDVTLYIDHVNATGLDGPDDPVLAAYNDAAAADKLSDVIVDNLRHHHRDDIIELLETHSKTVHDASRGIVIRPPRHAGDDLPVTTRSMLAQLCDTDDDAALATAWHGGRPPLGCTSEDGELRRGETFDKVRRVLQRVRNDSTSKTDAAETLGCTRKTIDNALDRPDLYRLE